MSFTIQNVDLGSKLVGIKNNQVQVATPFLVSATQTLSISNFIQILECGLQASVGLGSINLTMPTGATIATAFPQLLAGQQVLVPVNVYASSGANTLTLTGNTNCAVVGGPLVITTGKTVVLALTSYGSGVFTFG
jgi:hypothetical protein